MKYRECWERLKLDKRLTLAVPKEHQKKVIKAMSKEKWKDKTYKAHQRLLSNGDLIKLAYIIEGDKITFYFRYPAHALVNL